MEKLIFQEVFAPSVTQFWNSAVPPSLSRKTLLPLTPFPHSHRDFPPLFPAPNSSFAPCSAFGFHEIKGLSLSLSEQIAPLNFSLLRKVIFTFPRKLGAHCQHHPGIFEELRLLLHHRKKNIMTFIKSFSLDDLPRKGIRLSEIPWVC